MSNCYFNETLDEFEFEDKIYKVDVEAKATAYYDPGRMYMPNGDPGYPPEGSFDLDEVESTWYEVLENGDEIEVEQTREMRDALWEYLEEHNDWFEFPEPDYEESDYD